MNKPAESVDKATLLRWAGAGCLFKFMDEIVTVRDLQSGELKKARDADEFVMADENYISCYCLEVYQGNGHIQPHDGSAERPQHVKQDDEIMLLNISGNWCGKCDAEDVRWDLIKFYIVLPNLSAQGGEHAN
jgi:hypothetical protein